MKKHHYRAFLIETQRLLLLLGASIDTVESSGADILGEQAIGEAAGICTELLEEVGARIRYYDDRTATISKAFSPPSEETRDLGHRDDQRDYISLDYPGTQSDLPDGFSRPVR